MDPVQGVYAAIMVASLIFGIVFAELFVRERRSYYLLWALGCFLFGARFPVFWWAAGPVAGSPILNAISITMIITGFLLLSNGIWKYIGSRYASVANILSGIAYLSILSLSLWSGMPQTACIGFAYLLGGILCVFNAVQLLMVHRTGAVLYYRILGVLSLGWFVQGICIFFLIQRHDSYIWFTLSTGFLFISMILCLLMSRLPIMGAASSRDEAGFASGAMRLGWFEIIPDKNEIAMSPKYYRLLGYDAQEFPVTIDAWLEHMDDTGREKAVFLLRSMRGKKRPRFFTCECKVRARDGQQRWIVIKGFCRQTNAVGRPTRYAAIGFDLTEEKKMVEALAEKNQQITMEEKKRRAILDSIPDAMLYLDLEWRVKMANTAACGLFRCPCDEMQGKSLQDLMGPERELIDMCASMVKNNDKNTVTDEIETRSGRIWRLRIRQVAGPEGEADGYVLVIEDRTEFHMQEEQRIQVEKMMAIGQMAGGLAHDLKNQMMVTLGNLTLIEEAVNRDSKAYEYIKRVENATKGTKDLIDNLLAFARKRPIEYARMDTHDVIESSVQLLRHSLARNVTIQTFLHAGHSVIRGDIYQMQSALFNLAINARDAMPEGGFLSIETYCVSVEADQSFQYSQRLEPGEYIRISISDTGCGMEESTIKRIFEPFFTTKPPGKGTGLGLSMVFGTVQSHHGAINVFSQPGEGTIFDIYLPLIEAYEEEQFAEDTLAQYRLM